MADVSNNFTTTCFTCGRQVQVRNGQQRRHGCRWRLLSRSRWRAHQQGWHSGYRFAVENRDDDLVLADADDYGTGWAAFMRGGGITVLGGEQ